MNSVKSYFIVREASHFNESLDRLEGNCQSNFNEILQNINTLKLKLKQFKGEKIEAALNGLNQRIASLVYRLNIRNPMAESMPTFKKLEQYAIEWKACKAQFDGEDLTEIEINKLKEVTMYTVYSEELLVDKQLRESFFDWILGKGNTVRPIVEFPATVKKINDCLLGGRIGFYGGDVLKVVEGDKKELTLPFEGYPINILDPKKEVTFKTGQTFSMEKIFQTFKNRHYNVGDLEFLQEGICNWNPQDWDVDLKAERWWEQLPVIETLTTDEANSRYDVNCDGENWVFNVKASREKPNLDIVGTHSYLEIAIPQNDKYQVYYIGKFTDGFPANFWQTFNVLTKVYDAVLMYPDENIFNLHRQQAGHAVIANEKEALGIMDSILEDIDHSKNKNFKFQFITENCSHWVWHLLHDHLKEERIPNLFEMEFTDVKSSGFVGKFFDCIRSLPSWLKRPVLNIAFFLLGGWRSSIVIKKNGEKRKIGVLATPPWDPDAKLFHPPCLFDKRKSFKVLI